VKTVTITLTEQELNDIRQGLKNAIGRSQERRNSPKFHKPFEKYFIELESRLGALYNRFGKLAWDNGIATRGLDDPDIDMSAAARKLRAIPSDKRSKQSRENGKKGGRPKNRICPICKKSVSVYRFADEWRFNQHYTDEKRTDGSQYEYYDCINSYAVAE
jgi:hypothetical protein